MTEQAETVKTGIMALVGKRVSQSIKFCGGNVNIYKLSVAEVKEIQELAKSLETDDEAGFGILQKVIKASVEGGSELLDEHFEAWPMDELSKLSAAIMKFSGIGNEASGN
jgi:hypothetical protein